MILSKFNQFKWILLLVAVSILLSCTQRDTHSGGEAGVYMSEVQAFRLLEQATFGPMDSDVKEVQSLGPVQWVESQLNAGSAYQSSSDSHQTHLQRYKAIAKMAEPSTYSTDTDFNNNFHGRTTTVISFSTDPGSKDFFGPHTPGFIHIPHGEISALENEFKKDSN